MWSDDARRRSSMTHMNVPCIPEFCPFASELGLCEDCMVRLLLAYGLAAHGAFVR